MTKYPGIFLIQTEAMVTAVCWEVDVNGYLILIAIPQVSNNSLISPERKEDVREVNNLQGGYPAVRL